MMMMMMMVMMIDDDDDAVLTCAQKLAVKPAQSTAWKLADLKESLKESTCCRMEEYGPCLKIFVFHKCLIAIGSEALLKVR